MTTAVGAMTEQAAAFLVIGRRPATAASQLAGFVVQPPTQTHIARASQAAGFVPYEIGRFTVPRTSQVASFIVYGTGVPDPSRTRAWTYTLDGHTFYMLDLGTQGTFGYDKSTKQWCKFETDGYGQWNMANGTMWGQDRIIGGDLLSGQLWELDPTAVLDNGWKDIIHVVTGGLTTRSRVYLAVDAVRLVTSIGLLDEVNGATITLEFSDDQGKTYSDPFTVDLIPDPGPYAEIAWRSLGSFMSPGRIFRITDVGGIVRIDGADAFIENFDVEQISAATEGG